MDMKTKLQLLSNCIAVTGMEEAIAAFISTRIPSNYKLYKDALNSLHVSIPGKEHSKKILLLTHYDEPGMIVTKREGQFLAFQTTGSLSPSSLAAQEVTITDGVHTHPGIIGARPPHILRPEEQKAPLSIDTLRIDLGLTEQDPFPQWILPGIPAVISRPFTELLNHRVCGKSLTDRCGTAILMALLQDFPQMKNDVYIVFASQYYNTFKGALVAAHTIQPHVALILDGICVSSREHPDNPLQIGKGPVSYFGPTCHKGLTNALRKTAKTEGIPLQKRSSGERRFSDIWTVQTAVGGISSALLELPIMYSGKSTEIVSISDMDKALKLIQAFLPFLDKVIKEEAYYA
ncbi:hypothetical protein [Aminobacterium mobile]|uniref:hypothetical protein n=1 Tax=Aminobacterium mobile TaxID=81467 RepID=UPI003314E2E2